MRDPELVALAGRMQRVTKQDEAYMGWRSRRRRSQLRRDAPAHGLAADEQPLPTSGGGVVRPR